MYLDKIDGSVARIISTAFPSYKGRKVEVKIANYPINVKSYWDGGSRDYFTFVNLTTFQSLSVPPQSGFDRPIEGADSIDLPAGFVCVKHTIFQGKDLGITILIHPANAPMLLESPQVELSPSQEIVLTYTRGLKSSYAGIADYRFHAANQEKGISREAWLTAKASLIADGYLNKAGAITPKGKNAIADKAY